MIRSTQMNHWTQLDILLVDPAKPSKPYRPWLRLTIDTCSRTVVNAKLEASPFSGVRS